jgi:hypothetical protein
LDRLGLVGNVAATSARCCLQLFCGKLAHSQQLVVASSNEGTQRVDKYGQLFLLEKKCQLVGPEATSVTASGAATGSDEAGGNTALPEGSESFTICLSRDEGCDRRNTSPRRTKAGYVFLGATVLVGVLPQQSLERGQHGCGDVGGVERRELDAGACAQQARRTRK